MNQLPIDPYADIQKQMLDIERKRKEQTLLIEQPYKPPNCDAEQERAWNRWKLQTVLLMMSCFTGAAIGTIIAGYLGWLNH